MDGVLRVKNNHVQAFIRASVSSQFYIKCFSQGEICFVLV